MNNMKQVNVTQNELEDLVCMSLRYCIGRKSIGSIGHSNSILNIIKRYEGEDWFDSFRQQLINDINMCVRDILLYSLISHVPRDINICDIYYQKGLNDKDKETLNRLYPDIIPWIKLMQYLDSKNHVNVFFDTGLQKGCYECFSYPYKSEGDWVQVFCMLKNTDNLLIDSYIKPEIITKIEKL